jgi:hypothetical protein
MQQLCIIIKMRFSFVKPTSSFTHFHRTQEKLARKSKVRNQDSYTKSDKAHPRARRKRGLKEMLDALEHSMEPDLEPKLTCQICTTPHYTPRANRTIESAVITPCGTISEICALSRPFSKNSSGTKLLQFPLRNEYKKRGGVFRPPPPLALITCVLSKFILKLLKL